MPGKCTIVNGPRERLQSFMSVGRVYGAYACLGYFACGGYNEKRAPEAKIERNHARDVDARMRSKGNASVQP
jgi:hypothetical protein